MRPCPRPLDPIDAEAVAAGAEPLLAPDAAAHARECPGCQALIVAARALTEALEGVSGDAEPVDLRGSGIEGLAERAAYSAAKRPGAALRARGSR